jgi:uncharacterized protein
MRVHRFAAPLLISLAILAGCGKSTPVSTTTTAPEVDPVRGHLLRAQPRLRTVKVWLGDQELTTEVASRPVEIATGMMFRTNMPENEAMIFVFRDVAPRNFYMRNCTVPLSAAYINPNGEILEIVNLQPHDEVGVNSTSRDIQFVLEVPQGWFSRHNISTGAVLRTPAGTLQQTFFGKK